MTNTPKFHFVVLAAQRRGIVNPLAEAAGVSHKCLIEMSGKPLIEHVTTAIAESGLASKISVSIEDETPLKKVSYVQGLKAAGLLRVVPSEDNLFTSVSAALKDEQDFPAVITTADNVLLTSEMVSFFCERAAAFDAALAMVQKEVLLAKYPDGQRNFHRFKNAEYSNCNLYAIVAPEALKAAEVFRTGGQFAKASVAKIINAFGLFNMLGYKYAWFNRNDAIARLGKRFGIKASAVDMPFPEAPIDVDNERTMKIAATILADRINDTL